MVAIPVGGFVVARQNRIVSTFRSAGATQPDRAKAAADLGVDEGMAFRLLCRNDVLRETGEHRLWLDGPRWDAMCVRRRRAALICVTAALLIIAAAVVWAAATR